MKEIRFRAWHLKENKMYYRAYQKWLHVLLCEDDRGQNGGLGRPARRAFYGDCILLESTGLFDKNSREVFEGDIVRVRAGEKEFEETVGPVPDSFGSSGLHPLRDVLKKHGIEANLNQMEIEVVGNEYENARAPEAGR